MVVVLIGLSSFMLILSPDVNPWLSVPLFGVAGLGMGLAYAPLTLIVLREAPVQEQGSASAALSLTDALGHRPRHGRHRRHRRRGGPRDGRPDPRARARIRRRHRRRASWASP